MSENLSKMKDFLDFFGRIFWKDFLDFWIFGFFRILISCSNFDLKKINFLILYFFQFLFFIFIFLYFLFLFFDYSAKFRAKKIVPIFEIPKVNESEDFLGFPLFSGFIRKNPDFLFLVPIFDKFFIFIFCKKFI